MSKASLVIPGVPCVFAMVVFFTGLVPIDLALVSPAYGQNLIAPPDLADSPNLADPRSVDPADGEPGKSLAPHGRPSLEHRHGVPDEPRTAEWIGRGLPWWRWTHLTGNWNDWRTRIRDQGLSVEGSWLIDISKVESGGVRRRTTTRSLFFVDASLDLEPLLAIPNATLGAQFYSQAGRDGSRDTGDVQAYDNLDAPNTQQLAELWFEQQLMDERLRYRLGKMDFNSEFAFVESAAEFINSSMGFSPTIASAPSYPDPAVGGVLFARASDWLEFGFGLFDGAVQEGVRTGRKGVSTVFDDPSDLFVIGEGRVTWELPYRSLAGRFVCGGWHHTGHFARFNGGPDSGTEGYYLIAEQKLWAPAAAAPRARNQDVGPGEGGADVSIADASAPDDNPEEDGRGLSVFLQFGVADEAVSSFKRHLGGGLRWQGIVPTRPNDVLGVGITHVELSDRPGSGFTESSEVAHELFYLAQITPWLFVQPDVQYITDPGGVSTVDDAIVVTLRVGLHF